MAFAILVCALVLFTVLYFMALMIGEVAVWLRSRVIEAYHARSQSLAVPRR